MNRSEYLTALREALRVLPEEERAHALRYYEEYFDDAGPENEQRVIDDLGDPKTVADQILADYRELTTMPHAQNHATPESEPAQPHRKWHGMNPVLLIVLVIAVLLFGIPLLSVLFGVLIAVAAAVFGILLAILLVLVGIPLGLLIAGIMLCGCSCILWGAPASALTTLGVGLALFALGMLTVLLSIKICTLFFPPLFRAVAALCRWPLNKLRNRRNGGENP